MALRKLAKLTKLGTKAGLAGGTLYIYYEVGLWKGSDETIENYEKFKKDTQALYEASPTDFKKWVEYASSIVNTNVEPYSKAATDFRKEWLNFDLTWLTESGDGIIKPTWNKGVSWTFEALQNSPQNIQKWSSIGWEKVKELTSESPAVTGSSETEGGGGSKSMKQ